MVTTFSEVLRCDWIMQLTYIMIPIYVLFLFYRSADQLTRFLDFSCVRLVVKISGTYEGYRARTSQHVNAEALEFHLSALKMSRGWVITGSR